MSLFSRHTKQKTKKPIKSKKLSSSSRNNKSKISGLSTPLLKMSIKLNKPVKKIKEYCEMYNRDLLGNPNPTLYNSCKINKYCRKTKCKNIDNRFKKEQTKKLGTKYQAALATAIDNKCMGVISTKNYKNCRTKAAKKFYKDNNLGELYDKMLECDTKTCSKERDIFYKNLFRLNKKIIKKPKMQALDELPPDVYLIQTN